MQVNVKKKKDSTKQKQENREAFNRHVAPNMRERREDNKGLKIFWLHKQRIKRRRRRWKENQKVQILYIYKSIYLDEESIRRAPLFDEYKFNQASSDCWHTWGRFPKEEKRWEIKKKRREILDHWPTLCLATNKPLLVKAQSSHWWRIACSCPIWSKRKNND